MAKHKQRDNKQKTKKEGKDKEIKVLVWSSVTNCADAGSGRSRGNVSQSVIKELMR